MKTVEIPDELLELLQGSRLASHTPDAQIRAAVALHLFQEGAISIGKAAELAGIPRLEFESLVGELRIPIARYDAADADEDRRGIAEARR